jgi:dTDP-4-amino-4,6-dideoxygalactose transaminase
MSVPFIDLTRQHDAVAADLDTALRGVVKSARFILGPEVAAFEREIAAYCGVAHAIGVGSGTDALAIALKASGVGPGDEVIVPAFTFFATAEVVTMLGATPVFADIERDRYGMNAASAARLVTTRTKAIVPVHLYGRVADMIALRAIADAHGLTVIEDAAQAIGADYRGRRAGGLGHAGCFSFYPTKNLGALGDGGLVTTDDPVLAERVRMLRDHGSRQHYFHELPGWCSRLDALQAAALRVKLRRLDGWTDRRRALAARYREALAGLPLGLPREAADERAVYHLFTVTSDRRDELRKHLDAREVGTAVHYPVPLHRQPVYRHVAASLPESERASAEVLSLPLFPELREAEVDEVVAAVRSFFVAS